MAHVFFAHSSKDFEAARAPHYWAAASPRELGVFLSSHPETGIRAGRNVGGARLPRAARSASGICVHHPDGLAAQWCFKLIDNLQTTHSSAIQSAKKSEQSNGAEIGEALQILEQLAAAGKLCDDQNAWPADIRANLDALGREQHDGR